jgi:hypothetical protein
MWMYRLLGVGTDATSLLDQAKGGKMRRVMLMLAAVAMMVSLFAVVAYAAEIQGTDANDELWESNRNDQIHGLLGEDTIDATSYSGDRDRAHGNKHGDTINVTDSDGKDIAYGGKGEDFCYGDESGVGDGGDKFISCEFINDVEQ